MRTLDYDLGTPPAKPPLYVLDMEDAISEVVYDVAVVGAGVMGSATACHIAGKGVKVVLVEQVITE